MHKIRVVAALSVAFLFLASSAYAEIVRVNVHNIEKTGEINLAVYDSANRFKNGDGVVVGAIKDVSAGDTTFEFDLPIGRYAIKVFVDANYNKELDLNFLGIPKEQVGFSNDATGNFGPPSFSDASFSVPDNKDLQINLISH